MTDYTTQAARDAAPTVAPVEGCYVLLRNGWLIDPNGIIEESDLDDTPYYLPANSDEDYYWINGGVCQRDTYPKGVSTVVFEPSLDIIATYTPAQLLAPRFEELIEAARLVVNETAMRGEIPSKQNQRLLAALKAMEEKT